jgi:competence protein ComEC
MIAVSRWVAALPGAIGRIPSFGTGSLSLMSLGIILLGLLRSPLRWTGAGMIALATLMAVATPQPGILIANDAQNVAVRGADGRLRLMRTGKDTFLAREWLAADADPRALTDATLNNGVSCDGDGCVVAASDGKLVALSLKPEALADDCAQAMIVVTKLRVPEGCAAQVIDQEMLQRQGTTSLRRTASGYEVTAIRPRGVDRPWSPAIAEAEDVTQARRAPTARPVDATPAESDIQADD